MSPKYDAMQKLLAERDTAYVMLALIALSLVGAWVGVDWLPVKVRAWLKNGYLIGGVGLFLFTLFITLNQ